LSCPTVNISLMEGSVFLIFLKFFFLCSIMCLDFLNSVLWCPLWFTHNNDVRFVFTSSCLSNLCYLCVSLSIVVSTTYCVVFFPFVCLRPVSCVPSVASCPFTFASSFSLKFIYLILCSYCLAMVRRRNMIIFVVYFIISNKFFNLLSNHKL
jgi:hypothetical protein